AFRSAFDSSDRAAEFSQRAKERNGRRATTSRARSWLDFPEDTPDRESGDIGERFSAEELSRPNRHIPEEEAVPRPRTPSDEKNFEISPG
ncbi:hypothetical protein K0M31_010341, partial [Melipona bicolor]